MSIKISTSQENSLNESLRNKIVTQHQHTFGDNTVTEIVVPLDLGLENSLELTETGILNNISGAILIPVGDEETRPQLINESQQTVALRFNQNTGLEMGVPGYVIELDVILQGYSSLGYSCAIDENYMVVGAPYFPNELGNGVAYIYEFINNEWTKIQTLSVYEGPDEYFFGGSCAISGDYLVIGASEENNGEGAAYIYYNNEGTWTQIQRIVGSDIQEANYFGYSCAIDGDYIIISATEHNEIGAAYVFYNSGGTWVETQKVISSDEQGSFGYSCGITDDFLVIGSPYFANNGTGAAYVFYNSGGTWVETQILTSDGGEGDRFGQAVDIKGDYIVIGAPGVGPDSGEGYVFYNSGGTWVETQTLVSSFLLEGTQFGHSCTISDDYIVVGVPGAPDGGAIGKAVVFYNSGGTWVETQTLLISSGETGDNFGYSCAIGGDHLVVGAQGVGDGKGTAYMFYNSGGTWTNIDQVPKLVTTNRYEYIWQSVAMFV